jgi:hypothetical protein
MRRCAVYNTSTAVFCYVLRVTVQYISMLVLCIVYYCACASPELVNSGSDSIIHSAQPTASSSYVQIRGGNWDLRYEIQPNTVPITRNMEVMRLY